MKQSAAQELAKILTNAEDRLWTDFKDAGAFDHPGTIGTGREQAVISFLRRRLPDRFGVATGEVMDISGRKSGQIDVLIYDSSSTPPILTQNGDHVLLGAEALLATIEVKSTLTKDETRKAVVGIGKTRALRPFGSNWGRFRPRAMADDGLPRYFASILAFDTDHGTDDWKTKELSRIRDASTIAKSHAEYIDRVAVLTRGLILPGPGRVATHAADRQVLGLWYSALLNFLAREVQRRKVFPWPDYESVGGRKWEQVLAEEFTAPTPKSYPKAAIRRYKSGT